MMFRFTYSLVLFFLLLNPGQAATAQTLNVTIKKKTGQTTSATSPVVFTVVFSASINAATFTAATIVLNGTATGQSITGIKPLGSNNTTFEVTVTANNDGTVVMSIPAAVYTSTVMGNTGFNPQSLVLDKLGNVYTANADNTISQITTNGTSNVVYGTTGKGCHDITIDASGNIYTANVTDKTISKIATDGTTYTYGTTGLAPFGIAIDILGNVYTTNSYGNTISKIAPDGSYTIIQVPQPEQAEAMVIDSVGNLYLANFGNSSVTKMLKNGTISNLGPTGSRPTCITIDTKGNAYTGNNIDNNITQITAGGISTTYGKTGANPQGIAIDVAGNIYTANMDDNNISKISPSGVSSIIGTTGLSPNGLRIDNSGNLYTANSGDYTVTKLSFPTGIALLGSTQPTNSASTSLDNGYVLPVKLVDFTVTSNNCAATFNWQTSAEINSSFYGIETSTDGTAFAEVVKIASKNSATGATYASTIKTASGTNYYRLKMVDADGNYTFSKTIAVIANGNCSNSLQVKVNPNPAKDFIIVEGVLSGNQLSLLNAAGILVSSIKAAGSTQRIDISKFAKGIYMLRIEAADGSIQTVKVVKL